MIIQIRDYGSPIQVQIIGMQFSLLAWSTKVRHTNTKQWTHLPTHMLA